MPESTQDSSPAPGESSEHPQSANIRIAIGIEAIEALDTLIRDYDEVANTDGAMRPAPPRHALIEEAIRSQIRRHRRLRKQGRPVPLPDKNAGEYRLGSVPRPLHALLVEEQQQLNAEHAAHIVALRDIVEAGIWRVIKIYRRALRELRRTVVNPVALPQPKEDYYNVSIGKDSLRALEALIRDLEHAAQTDDLAEPVPARKALLLEAVRLQIQRHRQLRQQGQSTPIPMQAEGAFQKVRLPWQLHAALLAERDNLQGEHLDELDHVISLREIADAGVRTLIDDYRQRLGESGETSQ